MLRPLGTERIHKQIPRMECVTPNYTDMDVCDGILVLGGGVREGGGLPPWVVGRFERALEINSTAPIVCLSAGTVHRPPPLNPEGYPIMESVAGAAYLLGRGVPPH